MDSLYLLDWWKFQELLEDSYVKSIEYLFFILKFVINSNIIHPFLMFNPLINTFS